MFELLQQAVCSHLLSICRKVCRSRLGYEELDNCCGGQVGEASKRCTRTWFIWIFCVFVFAFVLDVGRARSLVCQSFNIVVAPVVWDSGGNNWYNGPKINWHVVTLFQSDR
mmetsp:Transcript_64015/g.113868  ORF Transcript_64015/g.113868 Transcript_64015/m.113868 type:complete len:111 (+) Transcript_64015:176-508(+)